MTSRSSTAASLPSAWSRPSPTTRSSTASGAIITPGLINTHHHLFQWMTRGRAIGCDLFGWLTTLYPVWGRLEVEDVHAAARVGIAELAASGCTSVFDHHYLVPRGDDSVFDAIVDAAREVGVRLFLSRGSMDLSQKDGGLPPDHVVEALDDILASTESVIARHHDGEMVTVVVAPCSPFSVSPELMQASANLARAHGLRLHTHLAETLEEQVDCIARFGTPSDGVARRVGMDRARRLGCARHPLRRPGSGKARRRRDRRGALSVVERAVGRGDVSRHRPPGRRQRRGPRRRRRGIERSGASVRRDATGVVHAHDFERCEPTRFRRPTRLRSPPKAGHVAWGATISAS